MISKKDFDKTNFERLNNDISIILSSPENVTYVMEILSLFFYELLSGENFNEHILYNLTQLKFDPQVLINDLKRFYTYTEYIYNTDEFIKLENLYDEYITEIAKLIKDCGDLDIYTQGIIHKFLMGKGILSKKDDFSYKKFSNDKDYKYSELGARITHGNGVCRNIAANLNDVFNKLGYDSILVSCIVDAEKSKIGNNPCLYTLYNLFTLLYKETNFHSIVAAKDKNGSIIIDPTWETFGRLTNENNNILELRRFISNVYEYKYCLNHSFYNNIHLNNRKSLNKIISKSNYLDSFSYEELIQKFDIIIMFLNKNLGYFIEWKNKNLDLMNEIDLLDKTLSNYSEQNNENIRKLKRF